MPDELERARALKAAFERAASGEQKNIEHTQAEKTPAERQPKDPERTTSAAKTIDPDALSRARSIKAQFERAATGRQHTLDRAQPDKAKPTQRHAPASQQHLRLQGPVRRAVDRPIFKQDQAKEDQRAREINEARQRSAKVQKMIDPSKSQHDKDRDGKD
jgi:hypothetical protein